MIANDIIRFIEVMSLDTVNIGGISDGASVAMHIGMNHPELVRNLILIGVNYFNDELGSRMNQLITIENLERNTKLAKFYSDIHDKYSGYWRQLIKQVVHNANTNLNYSLMI